eukprot:bmy_01579T0
MEGVWITPPHRGLRLRAAPGQRGGTACVSSQQCCPLGKKATATPKLPAGARSEPDAPGVWHPRGAGALWEHGLGEVQPIGLALTTPFLAKAQTALDPSSPLPSAPGLKPPPTASTGLELLPPSSFMLRGAEAHTWPSARPTIPGLSSQAPSSLASVSNPRLLLPGDFTGTRPGPGSDTAGVYLGPVSASRAQVTPGTWNPWVQPGPRREDGQDQAYSPIATGHMDLEAELEGIQQQLQDYQTTKQNLRSCQRQASSLRQWLELSQEEPRPDDQEAERQVQEELQEVEAQIQQLASKLQAQHQPIRTCIARVHALRQALC